MTDEKKTQQDDSDKAATQRIEDAEKRNDEVRANLKGAGEALDKANKSDKADKADKA